ncbi:uncharacterized protein Hap1MRO34_015723 [Clarias gariepinus]
MCVADKLCEELFRLIDKHKKCAKHLMALANELEKMREAMSVGQLVVNTATVVGSATLIGTGIATLLTGGLASPLLVAAAGVTVGAGTVTSFALSLAEKWKSSDTMKKAEKTFDKIQTIENNIKRLQKKLSKECGSQDLKVSSSDVMQFETTARILEAMARRSGRDLPLSRLKRILRNAYIFAQYRNSGLQMSPSLNAPLLKGVSALLITLGYSFIIMKSSARKGISFSIPLLVRGSEDVLKSIFKGAGQVAGGVIGLVLTVPDLIKNCEELIKNKHQTEASKYLKEKAKEIRKAVKKLKKELSDLQETLNQIPEMECHIDLSQEMFGNHIYTRCTICMEYKTTQKQGRRIQKFILLCKKDLKITGQGSTGKCKSDDNKNIRQRYTSSTVTTPSPNLQKKLTIQKKPITRSCTKLKDFQFGLPKITMSNVHSLPNTMREIEEMMEEVEYFDSNLMFFTDTINLEGYHSNRVDHDASLTQKYRGGGMLMLVNEAWATDVEVINIRITQDYEQPQIAAIGNVLSHEFRK